MYAKKLKDWLYLTPNLLSLGDTRMKKIFLALLMALGVQAHAVATDTPTQTLTPTPTFTPTPTRTPSIRQQYFFVRPQPYCTRRHTEPQYLVSHISYL
jgi:hypothetical protein